MRYNGCGVRGKWLRRRRSYRQFVVDFRFHETPPDLAPFVDFILQMHQPAGSLKVRNFPAPALSLVFNYGDPFLSEGNNSDAQTDTTATHRLTLEGFQKGPMRYTARGSVGLVIVALRPETRAALPELGDLARVHGNHSLEDLFRPRARFLPEAFADRGSDRIALVQDFLRAILRPARPGPRAAAALQQILSKPASCSTAELSRALGVSKRQLDREFLAGIGTTPKQFSRVVRMRSSLGLIRQSKFDLTAIAHESGYYDQSHFIKDFKAFTGYTPSAYRELRESQARNSAMMCDGNLTLID